MDLTPSQASSSEEEPAGSRQQPEPGAAPAPAAGPASGYASSPTPDSDSPPAATSVSASQAAAAGAGTVTLGRGTAARTGKEIGGKKFRVGTGDEYVPFRSRTKRRRRLIMTSIVIALLVAAGGYGAVSLFSSPSQTPAASACAARANAAAAAAVHKGTVRLPTAAQIKLNVYNSTDRHGLAAATAAQLKQRGFTIGKVTNDPLKANLTVPAQVRGGATSSPAMHVVAAEVPGAQVQPDARTDGTVDLVLGTGFSALASPDQVSAALKAATATPAKATSACAS